MIKKLLCSIREYKASSIRTSVYAALEVLMEIFNRKPCDQINYRCYECLECIYDDYPYSSKSTSDAYICVDYVMCY